MPSPLPRSLASALPSVSATASAPASASATMELFEARRKEGGPTHQSLAPGAMVLRAFAVQHEAALMVDLQKVIEQAPLRHMLTPGGFRMSVAMSTWPARMGSSTCMTICLSASDSGGMFGSAGRSPMRMIGAENSVPNTAR